MKNIIKVMCLLLTICSIFIFSLAGCNKTTEEDSQKDVEVDTEGTKSEETAEDEVEELKELEAWGVVDVQLSAQQIIADKMGYFEEEGLKVNNKFVQSGAELSPMIAGGTAKVSFESTYSDIALASNNVGVTILAPVCNIGGTQTLVAGPNFEVELPKDLEGANIGMAPGSGVLIAIRKMCDELDVDIDTFNFVSLQPADQVAALEKGDIDVMACWEPGVSKGVDLGGKVLFSGLQSYLPGAEGEVDWLNFHATLQVTNDMLEEPDTLVSFLSALNKANDYINNEREAAAGILAEELELEKDLVLSIMARNSYSLKIDQGFLDGINEMSAFMKEMSNIEEQPELSSFIDSSFLSDVDPSLVEVEIE